MANAEPRGGAALNARNADAPDAQRARVTCVLRYRVVPSKLPDFERYARLWIRLVGRYGGEHHGYFLPSEGASDVALALFSFDSLADYEAYRQASARDPECQAAYRLAEESQCIVRYERSFLRPVFGGANPEGRSR